MKPRRGFSHGREGHQYSDDQPADDVFSTPKRQQISDKNQLRRKRSCDKNSKQVRRRQQQRLQTKHQLSPDRHRKHLHGDQPRPKRSCNKNRKQLRRRPRLQNGDQNENQSNKNQGQNQPTDIVSYNDIFAVPSQQQTTEQPLHQPLRTHQHSGWWSFDQNEKQVADNHPRPNGTQQQHQEVSTARNQETNEMNSILEWDSPIGYVPVSEEESMVEFMFQRNGKHERGMMKGKPSFVVVKYRKAMQKNAPSMNFPQMLSLRRHHIKLFNQSKDMTKLGLGKRNDINKSAKIFESAIEAFLKKSAIDFLTEEDQKKEGRKNKQILKATPDFLMPKPILLRKIQSKKKKKGKSNKNYRVLEERTINWIEAKMYYGASSIPHGSDGAVGCVLKQAKKYVDAFGEGAILFMMGCGEKLASDMNNIGVSVLDCSGNTVCIDPVCNHQRTWCANENGTILP